VVERRRLTPEFVYLVQTPRRGERWIADTKLRGFGLRLWSTKSGGQKAFAIRISDESGNAVRKTFSVRSGWRTNFELTYSGRHNTYGLGEYLDEAREWARDEIDRLKGRLTVSDENWIRHKVAGNYVKNIALDDAAQALLSGMRADGRAQRYLDRLDKLFSNNVTKKLKRTSLDRVSAKAMANCLVNVKIPAGNIRILRSFVGQIFERAASFHGPLGRFSDELSTEFRERWEQTYDVRYPELRRLTKSDFQVLFAKLEADKPNWQSALCIRLFFEFHSPLSRIFSGQWAQMSGDHWYPYWPDEKVLWYESRESINEAGRTLLDRISDRVRRDFGSSRYWFPTRFGRKVQHIRTVDSVWRNTLRSCGMNYYPLREFARSYREPNCPSYYIAFLRQYGSHFRELDNVAELSKKLLARKVPL
jgi:hypothetical protein